MIFVCLAVFVLIQLAPGDPADDAAGDGRALSPALRAEFRAAYHLDDPPLTRFFRWLSDAGRGELGRSFEDRRPVTERIAERLPTSLVLNAAALLLMTLFAVPAGIAAAARPGSGTDRALGVAASALFSVPVFWAAVTVQGLFAARVGWLPLYGLESEGAETFGAFARTADRAWHLVLPAGCLAYGGFAYVSRFVRSSILEGAANAGLRSARARGSSAGRALFTHGLSRSAIPLLTLAGFLLPRLVGGSVLVERVFGIPGLGDLFFRALLARDLPVVLGLTLVSAAATLAGITLADVLCVLADPRIRRAA